MLIWATPDFLFGLSGKILCSGGWKDGPSQTESLLEKLCMAGLAAPVRLGAGCPVPQGAHGLAVELQHRRKVCDHCPGSAIPAVPAQQTVLGSSKQHVQASSPLSPSQRSCSHSSVALWHGRTVHGVQWWHTMMLCLLHLSCPSFAFNWKLLSTTEGTVETMSSYPFSFVFDLLGVCLFGFNKIPFLKMSFFFWPFPV